MNQLERLDRAWRVARYCDLSFEQWRALAHGEPVPAKRSRWQRLRAWVASYFSR